MSEAVQNLATWMLTEIKLNKHLGDGLTYRDHLRHAANAGNADALPLLRNDPPEGLYNTAMSYRAIVGFGARPTYGEIDAYMRLTGFTLTANEIALIQMAHREVEYFLNRKVFVGDPS